jgi:opacity protein-like surface antigen
MKRYYLALLVSLVVTAAGFAQDEAKVASPTTTFIEARMGMRTDAPYVGTYHYVEAFQLRGKWIYPDVGYIDFATLNYHELFIGAGRTLVDNKRLMMAEELYFDQAIGPDARSARYLQPWTLVQLHFSKRFGNETVYFPYLPLNSSARVQHVLECSKFEYALNKTWKIGAGYAGYRYGNDHWQNKPMITTTVSTRAGSFEVWLQKMPGGAQVQLRYELAYTRKK